MKSIIEIEKRKDELMDQLFSLDDEDYWYYESSKELQIAIETLEYVLK